MSEVNQSAPEANVPAAPEVAEVAVPRKYKVTIRATVTKDFSEVVEADSEQDAHTKALAAFSAEYPTAAIEKHFSEQVSE